MHGRRKTHLGADASMRPAFHHAARRRGPSTSQVAAVKSQGRNLASEARADFWGQLSIMSEHARIVRGGDTKEEKTGVVCKAGRGGTGQEEGLC